ncbi:ectonucleoside triphosphate diphosphohydrolase 1-like isoform X4 [Daphnia pulicaria]|uniref:ectonucleoside triphosphate diphosphohydrolase 1-like isoform X4 n=1 Tax=Daphnia pulicaria TaxID=35523 RepID=UPI001EEA23E8|nr:ectonucleoside triphosphate diphosphohydrolase 1-like isoform X4 [Daphnia pulicaria]
MLVTIESTIGGNVAGYLQCTVTGNETISSLLSTYCESKGIPVNPNFLLRDQKGVVLDNKKTLSASNIKHGDTLYLEIRGMQNGVFRFTSWWLLAFGAIFIAVGGFAVVITLHNLTGPTPIEYGVVLDGGSSHTAVFVYQWPGPKWKGTGVLQQIGVCNIVGDIASFYNNVAGVDAFLTPCLSYASSKVPSASQFNTPIYFGGTAGLRLLNISQPSATSVLLDSIRNRLSRSGFRFDWSYVEILSGMDEAQFSWVTVNTQLMNVGPEHRMMYLRDGSQETVGALDLGGASTQLALQVPSGHEVMSGLTTKSNEMWREDDVCNLQLYSQNYSVYSQSSLCYGVLEVIKRYESMLIVESGTNGSNVLESPCQPLGYSTVVKADNIFNSPCSQNRSTSVQEWTLNGTSNYHQCFELIERLFNSTYCQSHFLPATCFSNEGQPSLNNQDFLAFSSFTIITRELNVTNTSSLADFRSAVQSVCNMTLDEILDIPLTIPNSSFVPLICLETQYILSLLTSGYGFDDETWQGLHFVKQISGTEVGWSMGYMTEKTNKIAAAEASLLLATPVFIALAILFTLFLIIGFLLSYHAVRMKRSANSYSRYIFS